MDLQGFDVVTPDLVEALPQMMDIGLRNPALPQVPATEKKRESWRPCLAAFCDPSILTIEDKVVLN